MHFFIKNKTIVYLFIILLAISPAFALGEGNRNLLLIGAMLISPLILLRYPIVIPKIDIPLVGLCLMMAFFPLILHPETMRWSTVLYSYLFCFFFMAFVRVFYHSRFTSVDFLRLLKGLIYAYCIVLIIQQICVLTGLPIFNVSNYDPSDPWKLNSLMSEPSHSARIVPIMMYIYLQERETVLRRSYYIKTDFGADKLVWFAFLWTIFTMGSATGFLFLILVLSKILKIRKFSSVLIIMIVGLGLTLVLSENAAFMRTITFTKAFLTFDETEMMAADHSAACRVVPSFIAVKQIDLSTLDGWFGYGVDAEKNLPMMPGVPVAGAGILYLWYNYGFFVALLYWIFTFLICYKRNHLSSILIWFLSVFIVGGINNQIVWLVLILCYTQKHIKITNESNSFSSWKSESY